MMQRASFLTATLLLSGIVAGVARESPVNWLTKLMAPPEDAVTEVFQRPPEVVASPASRDVPMPSLRAGIVDAETTPTLRLLSYAPSDIVPLPAPRPAAPFDAVAALPDGRLPTLTEPPPAARSTCGAALAMFGVQATALDPMKKGRCGIAAPVAVASLDDGSIFLSTKAVIECATAERLANWLHDTVQAKARSILDAPLTGVRVAASYACRNRNSLPDARLSEHAKGRAIDISAFRVGDRWIAVKSGWLEGGDDTAFLKAVRESACGPFNTVLGPGSDKYHTDHFHLDLAKRRNGSVYCR